MEYNTWRPWQPSGSFCPVCSNSHFPFCPPPPPIQQYYRPPPPPFPSDQFFPGAVPAPPIPSPIPYNHYAHHPPVNPYPPSAVYPSPRPWNAHSTLGGDYGNSNCEVDVEGGSRIGVKRMRLETFGDDARRLRLVRDHGVKGHSMNRNYNGGEHASVCNSSISVAQQHNLGDRDKVIAGSTNAHGIDGLKMLDPSGRNNANLASECASYADTRQRNSSGNWDFNNQGFHSNMPNSATYAFQNNKTYMHPVNEHPTQFASPIPSLSVEPSRYPFPGNTGSLKPGPRALFPVVLDSGASHASRGIASEATGSASLHYPSPGSTHSGVFRAKENQGLKLASADNIKSETAELSSKLAPLGRPTLVDASHILKHPYRANRPDNIVIILRGLPGSGKSYLAKVLRDLEVENGGSAPRIHSMDEYFMNEIEKVEESDKSSISGTSRTKKPTKGKVMEYVYEPEMEEVYRSSMLKAFKKSLDEGVFPFVIVDDRNLRVADFAQFWATAKSSGYEVYLLEATYKDPAGCAARNVHGFTLEDIQKMANQWEDASSLYMRLDAKSLLHGDSLEGNCIQEVDMDTEETNCSDELADSGGTKNDYSGAPTEAEVSSNGILRGEFVEDNTVEPVKELEESKWSNDLDDEVADHTEAAVGSSSTISIVTKHFGKQGKSVRWADQNGSIGFSIGAGKVAYVSLMIGPGSGYNYKSNPLPEEEKLSWRNVESRKQSVFQDQLRAERESFRAVFDERRHHRFTAEDDQS